MGQDSLNEYAAMLLAVLDEDAEHMRRTIDHLNALRAAVIRRDEAGLKQLLDEVEAEGQSYRLVEMKRKRACNAVAGAADHPVERLNLSGLCEIVSEHVAEQVRARQTELKDVVQTLRMEHACTMALLRECSRLNRTLLNGMLGRSHETLTYTAHGSETWCPQNDMVNIKL